MDAKPQRQIDGDPSAPEVQSIDWQRLEIGFSVSPFCWACRFWRYSGSMIIEFGPFAIWFNS